MKTYGWAVLAGYACILLWMPPQAGAAEPDASAGVSAPSVWERDVGEGFRDSVRRIGVAVGTGPGVTILGSQQAHDIVLSSVSYGRMMGGLKGVGSSWRGNWEPNVEILGGVQIHPNTRYILGFTPHLRYNFSAGSRTVPFVDLGTGVTATNIGPPELGDTFQFNLQGCGGVNRFLKNDMAVSLEARFLHLSSARISLPNHGVNAVLLMVGVSWFD
jgi:hypothetical protein